MTNDTTSAAPADGARAQSGQIDPAWSVNEVLRRHPAAVAVFNALGVDACCGGAVSLGDAARDAGLEPAALLEALDGAVRRRGDDGSVPGACACAAEQAGRDA